MNTKNIDLKYTFTIVFPDTVNMQTSLMKLQ